MEMPTELGSKGFSGAGLVRSNATAAYQALRQNWRKRVRLPGARFHRLATVGDAQFA